MLRLSHWQSTSAGAVASYAWWAEGCLSLLLASSAAVPSLAATTETRQEHKDETMGARAGAGLLGAAAAETAAASECKAARRRWERASS